MKCDGACPSMRYMRNVYKMLVGKTEKKSTLGKPRRRCGGKKI
jgi:hypothetical protein